MNRGTPDREHLGMLHGIASGDESAFNALYAETSQAVFFYLLRFLGNRESAEDVMVEVFTVVWESASRFQGRSRVKTWILGIARNLALKSLQKRRFHQDLDTCRDLADDRPGADLETLEDREIVRKALLGISEKHREVLDLVFYHDLPYREIADLLGIPVNTVKTRVYHAKEALKRALAGWGDA